MLLFKIRFLHTAPDPGNPVNPPEMEHELRLATHQQRAGGQDDGSLNKLPQIMEMVASKAESMPSDYSESQKTPWKT